MNSSAKVQFFVFSIILNVLLLWFVPLAGFFSMARTVEASAAIRHAKMMGKSGFLINKVELFQTAGHSV